MYRTKKNSLNNTAEAIILGLQITHGLKDPTSRTNTGLREALQTWNSIIIKLKHFLFFLSFFPFSPNWKIVKTLYFRF